MVPKSNTLKHKYCVDFYQKCKLIELNLVVYQIVKRLITYFVCLFFYFNLKSVSEIVIKDLHQFCCL